MRSHPLNCAMRLLIKCAYIFLNVIFSNVALAQPVITGFSPTSGPVGTTVTISGTGFDNSITGNLVRFGAVKATITAASSQSLMVTVPGGVTYEPITVTSNTLTGYSNQLFNSTFPGAISPFNTTSFSQNIDVPTVTRPNFISIGDMNGDNKPDVLTINPANGSTWLEVFVNSSTTARMTFQKNTLSATVSANCLALGDLDGDGRTDVALDGFGSGIAILKNNSSGGTVALNRVSFFSWPITHAIALLIRDLDSDGKPDLAALNPDSNTISLYKNTTTNGVISFAGKVDIQTASNPRNFCIGDIDDDGKPDFVVANNGSNTVSVLRNTSTAGVFSFDAKTDFAVGQYPQGIAVGDFDNDNKVDIAVANSGFYPNTGNTISILRNTSSMGISFAAKLDLITGSSPVNVAVNDWDGDGKPDLAVTHSDTLSVFKNTSNGSISFAERKEYPSNYPGKITSCDLNGDTYPEIIATGNGPWFSILKNQVTVEPSSFVPPVIKSFSPASGAVGSQVTITGTGFSTIAANNIVYFGAVRATVNSASTTSLSVTVPPQSTPQPISVTRDLLTGYASMPFLVTFPGGEAPFHSLLFDTRVDSTVNGNPQGYCASDLDGDGKPDMVIIKTGLNYQPGSLSVYKNTGSARTIAFAPPVEIQLPNNPTVVIAADLNGDGKPDLAVSSNTARAGFSQILINTSTPGTISFSTPYTVKNTGAIAAADFDGDGRTDLAMTVYNGVRILRNMTVNDSVFLYEYPYVVGQDVAAVAATDLSGDGKPEIVLVSRHDQTVRVLRNFSTPGNMNFVAHISLPAAKSPYDVAVADIDKDGKTDIAIVDYFDSTVSVYRNSAVNGGLGFHTRVNFKSGYGTCKLTLNDLNGDGKPDISVVNRHDSTVAVYKNISAPGSISFETQALYKTGPDPVFVDATDWDGDGQYDLTVANGDKTFSVFKNKVLRPVLSAFTPAVVTPGTTVTINGYNFNTTTQVKLGTMNARSFTIISNNQITAIADEGAEGDVSVTTPYGTGVMASVSFAAPVITAVVPETGVVGTTVTITGSNFSTVRNNNHVYFGSVKAMVTAATTTSLTVQVPAGAAPYQPVSVSTFSKIAWSPKPFLLTFGGIGNAFTDESFAGKVNFSVQNGPKSVSSGDLDGDGLPDLVVANFVEESLSILKNNGSNGKISFEAAINTPFLQDAVAVKMVDINADGKLDVVAISHTHGLVEIRLNNSTPGMIKLDEPLRFNFSDNVLDFAAADFDQDGRTDLVVLRDNFINGHVGIMRNTSANGVVSFTSQPFLLSTSSVPRNIAVADLNADGKPDLLVSFEIYAMVRAYKNISTNGAIAFDMGPLIEFGIDGPDGLAAGDIDGDGKPELAVAANTAGSLFDPSISIFKNSSIAGGAISFGTRVDMERPSALVTHLHLGDMDGDGKIDIVSSTSYDSVMVHKNTSASGNISFLPGATYQIDHEATGLCLIDIDTDGKADIVSVNRSNNISVLRNKVGEPLIVPSGANPVSGTIANRVTVDPTVQTLNGNAYVQRHYDIMPENNAATATATITLYFTQQEFDNFNAYPGHGADLPKNSNDAAGKASIRIYQYHGFSATNLPGTYTGLGNEIDPDDANIVWNAARQWWEITFTVQGFSGFFLSTAGFNYNQVPAPVITARSAASFCVGGSVELVANIGINNQWHKDGVVIDGANEAIYQTSASGTYTVTATNNGITSPPSAGKVVQVSAVPAKPLITQNGNVLVSSIATGNQWYLNGAVILNATGQTYKPTAAGNYSVKVTTGSCAGPESEKYNFIYTATIDLDDNNFISLTPNPVKDKAYLKFTLNAVTTLSVQVFNLQGQVAKTWNNLPTGASLDLLGLPGGIYFVRVMNISGNLSYTFRLLKL